MSAVRTLGLSALALALGCETPSEPAAVAVEGPSFAMGAPAHTVSGSGQIFFDGSLRNFQFTATGNADGSATGSFELHARQAGARVHGQVVCATVFGDAAWLGGVITSPGPFEGRDGVWRVVDLGSGVKGLPDLISLFGPRPPGTARTFCEDTPGFALFETQGDITVVSPGSSSFTSVDFVEFTGFPVFIPCADGGNGELVFLSGTLQFLFHFNEDPAGGFHVTSEANPQDLSGLGLTTGDRYQGTGGTGGHTNFTISGVPFTDSFVNNFRIIGEGPGNNFLVHLNAQFTVNANGQVTVSNVNFTSDCK